MPQIVTTPPSIFQNSVQYFSTGVELDTLMWTDEQFNKLDQEKIDAFLWDVSKFRTSHTKKDSRFSSSVFVKHVEIIREIVAVLDAAEETAAKYDKEEDVKMALAASEAADPRA